MREIYCSLLFVGILAAADVSPESEKSIARVSLVGLIASPGAYDEKKVSVIGYISTGYEDEILYIHREDYENSIPSNGVRLVIPEQMRGQLKSGRYVEVHGVFRMYTAGDTSNGMAGRITSITKIEPWFLAAQEHQGRGCW
ncbi:hypothetical protein [Cystobacter fuscus]|uniref:hypothetical protein n=1 Tax=Cystobacter fuscus TaxID=43 RepID=UPI00138AC30C|nr:hypothetical protein [Cystobacter fuscus]